MELSRYYKNDVYLSRVGRILFSIFLTIFFSSSVADTMMFQGQGFDGFSKAAQEDENFAVLLG